MAFSSHYPLETRQAVERLLRESDLSMLAIARQSGVTYAAVKFWNALTGTRPRTIVGRLKPDPRGWTARRRQAASRLFGRGDVDPGDIAEALGYRRGDAGALALACGGPPAMGSLALGPSGDAPDVASLDTALRAHIARQIAAFDDILHGAEAGADTARVLRDLGGLKRLLDDLAARETRPDAYGDADGASPQDLAARRERIARRYEAFEAERHDAGLPGDAAAGGAGLAGA